MNAYYIFLGLMLSFASSLSFASERYLLTFELNKNGKNIETGNLVLTKNQSSWRKGLKRGYLKLRCIEQQPDKIQKILSVEYFFSGFEITHQQVKNQITLKVVHTEVESRLSEISALNKNECKLLKPVVNITKQKFSFQVTEGIQENNFSENMVFRAEIKVIGAKNK